MEGGKNNKGMGVITPALTLEREDESVKALLFDKREISPVEFRSIERLWKHTDRCNGWFVVDNLEMFLMVK